MTEDRCGKIAEAVMVAAQDLSLGIPSRS